MNKINFKTLMYLFLFTFLFGCNKNDNPLKQNSKEGGLIDVNTNTVVYFINTMSDNYDVELRYYQGVGADISSIDVYKQFYTTDDTGGVITSPKTLFKTLDFADKNVSGVTKYTASFSELAAGTTINGVLIPQADSLLKPGFYWLLTYDIKLDDGRHVIVPKNTIFINSRFAGKYTVAYARYYRSGTFFYDEGDWPSPINVTALNATTFRMEAGNPFGQDVYFTIDDASGKIEILKSYAGNTLIINNFGFVNCVTEPGAFNYVSCDISNIAIKVASTKDTIKMVYGYINPGGSFPGTREFTQVMVKQ